MLVILITDLFRIFLFFFNISLGLDLILCVFESP